MSLKKCNAQHAETSRKPFGSARDLILGGKSNSLSFTLRAMLAELLTTTNNCRLLVVWLTVWALGGAVFCCFLNGSRGAWLVHYCGYCGLRLLIYDEYLRRRWLQDNQLVEVLPDLETGSKVKVAPSPYPETVSSSKTLISLDGRSDTGVRLPLLFTGLFRTSLSAEICDESHKRKLYDVKYPDCNLKAKFRADIFG